MNQAASGIYKNGYWRERVATALEPAKKRVYTAGTGRPVGPVIVKGKPVPMTMGALSLYMQGTKL